MCSEAVKTQSRVLILGASLADFMKTLGVYSSGGGREHTKLRNQMRRLFNAYVQLIYEDKLGEASVNAVIARRTEFWWNERKPDEPMLWKSKIELSEDFFNEIITHPVPIDLNTLTSLKRSSLGLDLYLWLVYRQFGVDPARASDRVTVRNFQRKVLRELKKIKIAWLGLNYSTAPGVLILHPSTPSIPPASAHRELVS